MIPKEVKVTEILVSDKLVTIIDTETVDEIDFDFEQELLQVITESFPEIQFVKGSFVNSTLFPQRKGIEFYSSRYDEIQQKLYFDVYAYLDSKGIQHTFEDMTLDDEE